MDLDLLACFGREKTPSYNRRNTVILSNFQKMEDWLMCSDIYDKCIAFKIRKFYFQFERSIYYCEVFSFSLCKLCLRYEKLKI